MTVLEVKRADLHLPQDAAAYGEGQELHVDRGEVFGFLGPSRAGKSTTQKILTGLLTGHGGGVSAWG